MSKPKILVLDIETAPIIAHVWGLWDNNVALNQIVKDSHLLSWSAKWFGDSPKKVMYMDQSKAKNIEDDKEITMEIWKLLDECDIVLTQNGKKFDIPRLNSRFVFHKLQPPSSYKHIDTLSLAKRHFSFTSNKLEFMTETLNTKYKKLKHKKFPGHELWSECLKGNSSAWKEMRRYNIHDVLALEELYTKLRAWDNSVNFSIYYDKPTCSCGSTKFKNNGVKRLTTGTYQRYKCKSCGHETRGTQRLDKVDRVGVAR